MRPVPVDAAEVWPGAVRHVMAPPGGDLTHPGVSSLDVVADLVNIEGEGVNVRYSAKCALEPGDLEKLAAGGYVWVSFYGAVVPFCVDVKGPGE